MSSRDFYLNPATLSNLFLQELENKGYWPLRGWRSNRQDVHVQTEDGRVVAVSVDGNNQVAITEINLASAN